MLLRKVNRQVLRPLHRCHQSVVEAVENVEVVDVADVVDLDHGDDDASSGHRS